jgi:hypothetical protein
MGTSVEKQNEETTNALKSWLFAESTTPAVYDKAIRYGGHAYLESMGEGARRCPLVQTGDF